MKYPFDKLFLVCTGGRCNDEKHGQDRGEEIRAELKEWNKKLGRKPRVRICAVSCLDLCDYGPNMVVEPEETVFSHLDRKKARAVYDGEMGDGPERPDLQLDDDELRR
ncbi:MAG TPA: (2Fe-2S) ferredoxin domain-containing protein [Thermoanaerobaculia bacterium]|nr:(2Fe-2S) ferredoxin domain-containing protein [Thermoanaerobaculia bacterium]